MPTAAASRIRKEESSFEFVCLGSKSESKSSRAMMLAKSMRKKRATETVNVSVGTGIDLRYAATIPRPELEPTV